MKKLIILIAIIFFMICSDVYAKNKQINTPEHQVKNSSSQSVIYNSPINVPPTQIDEQPNSKNNPSPQIEIKPLDEHILEIALGRLDKIIAVFGILMTVLTIFFGAGISYIQYRQGTNLKNEIDILKKEFNYQEDFKKLKSATENKVIKHLDLIPDIVHTKVESLFESKYKDKIFRDTRTFSAEALMLTTEERNILLARLRSMCVEIQNELTSKINKEVGEKLYQILGRAIQNWHTLGELSNPDRGQLKAGLLAIHANPFPEASILLKKLKVRYGDDGELFPLIHEAITAVENLSKAIN